MSDLLVIGYGNTLRRDDGLGPHVAAAVAALALPGVRVRVAHQLAPEMAEAVAMAKAVVFIDAVADSEAVAVCEVLASGDAVSAHGWGPGGLLALTQAVYGAAPPAYLVAVPGAEFGLGESLSAAGSEHARAAVKVVVELIQRLRASLESAPQPGARVL